MHFHWSDCFGTVLGCYLFIYAETFPFGHEYPGWDITYAKLNSLKIYNNKKKKKFLSAG